MTEGNPMAAKHLRLEESYSFSNPVIDYIQHAAEYGLYEIRGLGAKRKVPTFVVGDDAFHNSPFSLALMEEKFGK